MTGLFMRYKPCDVSTCERNAHRDASGKRGYCSMHYSRWLKHGDPLRVDATPSPAKDWLKAHINYEGDMCLRWPFATGADGYGRVHRFNNGSLATASHVMCEMVHGPRPSPKHECAHSCGKGAEGCVHPKHLRWATFSANQMDRVDHGTSNRGRRQWLSRLTEDDVRNIRRMGSSLTHQSIADRFSVSQSQVTNIINRKRWAWLD